MVVTNSRHVFDSIARNEANWLRSIKFDEKNVTPHLAVELYIDSKARQNLISTEFDIIRQANKQLLVKWKNQY